MYDLKALAMAQTASFDDNMTTDHPKQQQYHLTLDFGCGRTHAPLRTTGCSQQPLPLSTSMYTDRYMNMTPITWPEYHI